jgi:polysaccharide pyruvyl transferase WcaK-like protein
MAIEDIRACFGPRVKITLATLSREKTLRAIPAGQAEVVQLPRLFLGALGRLAARHDVTFLVEGSAFKENWSPWLLYAFLWAAFCSRRAGKRCVAYAVDAGELSWFNRLLAARVCDGIDLILTRTEVARQRLLAMGVRRPILTTTDTAFPYLIGERPPADSPGPPTVGIAPLEFFFWPVRFRLFGRRENCYRWPFYFTWDKARRAASERMVGQFQGLVRHCLEAHGLDVQLIAMEDLDTAVCTRILEATGPQGGRVRLASARDVPPDRMVPLLRGLSYLVTSRYHACVLSMASAVPQMAVCHDERLATIYQELGMDREFLLDYRDPELGSKLIPTFDRLVRCGPEVRALLRQRHDHDYLPRCRQNPEILRAWARGHFDTRAAAAAPVGSA